MHPETARPQLQYLCGIQSILIYHPSLKSQPIMECVGAQPVNSGNLNIWTNFLKA